MSLRSEIDSKMWIVYGNVTDEMIDCWGKEDPKTFWDSKLGEFLKNIIGTIALFLFPITIFVMVVSCLYYKFKERNDEPFSLYGKTYIVNSRYSDIQYYFNDNCKRWFYVPTKPNYRDNFKTVTGL